VVLSADAADANFGYISGAPSLEGLELLAWTDQVWQASWTQKGRIQNRLVQKR